MRHFTGDVKKAIDILEFRRDSSAGDKNLVVINI